MDMTIGQPTILSNPVDTRNEVAHSSLLIINESMAGGQIAIS
jgi:hypothetical protein